MKRFIVFFTLVLPLSFRVAWADQTTLETLKPKQSTESPSEIAHELCNRLLTAQVNPPSKDLRPFIRSVSNWYSPTMILARFYTVAPSDVLFSEAQISTSTWKALIENSIGEAVTIPPEFNEFKLEIFRFLTQHIDQDLQIPQKPIRLMDRVGSLFGWKRTRVLNSIQNELEEPLRGLWKSRQDGNLRLLNPEFFRSVPEQSKYSDTYKLLVMHVARTFELEQKIWPNSWLQWLSAVDQFLMKHFAGSPPEDRRLIIRVLEEIFLRTPSLPSETRIIAFVASLKSRTVTFSQRHNGSIESPTPPASGKKRRNRPLQEPVPVPPPDESKAGSTQSIEYQLNYTAAKDLEKLPDNLKAKFEQFIGLLSQGRECLPELHNSSWQMKKLNGPYGSYDWHSVRLNRGYRVLFYWENAHQIVITNIDKVTSHNN